MSAVRAETVPSRSSRSSRPDRVAAGRRRSPQRAAVPSPRAARSSARSLPQESTGPRARLDRWRVLAGGTALAALLIGGLCIFVQGQRIAAQEEADGLGAELDRARARQRELVVELSRAEMPDEMLRRAGAAGMVEPGPVAAIPSAPVVPPSIPSSVPSSVADAVPSSIPVSSLPSTSPAGASASLG